MVILRALFTWVMYRPPLAVLIEGEYVGYGVRHYSLLDIVRLMLCPVVERVIDARSNYVLFERRN